ncbi:MAG: NAD(P)-binding protein [Pseudomonadota bacterium]
MSAQLVNLEVRSARVAVVGAGVAGLSLARWLANRNTAVHVFDKSRGVGGRMATRRMEWVDGQGVTRTAALDHGVGAFAAHSMAFQARVAQVAAIGSLVRWQPKLADGLMEPAAWVSRPDMPAWCRRMAEGLPLTLYHAVDAVRRDRDGWSIMSEGDVLGSGFDHVVLAMPPVQAAVLLAPHRPDWSEQAGQVPMQPCWTLMGVSASPPETPTWESARPLEGPLASVWRNDSKPGRERLDGHAAWVAHARADWSETHLEDDPSAVQAQLLAAMNQVVGHEMVWRRSVVHRWRYAHAPAQRWVAGRCWWDPALGLGVCGDFLGGGGVEGAWQSADALAQNIDAVAMPEIRQMARP